MSIPVYKNERKNPMSGMTSGPEPRYSYAKPTDKPTLGAPPQLGTDITAYNLPVTDTQTGRRNFPGYSEAQVYSLEELISGDTAGTTETDSVTQTKESGGYTKINQKSGGKGRSWKTTSARN